MDCVQTLPFTRRVVSLSALGLILSWLPASPESLAWGDDPTEHGRQILYQRIAPTIVAISARLPTHSPQSPHPSANHGTGMILDESGTVLTAAHLVQGAIEITATLHTGSRLRAQILAIDSYTDMAVIRLFEVGESLTPAALGDSNALHFGQVVHVVGAPASDGLRLTSGIIVNLQPLQASARLIETTAPIKPDNSGGPLIDSEGRIIGIILRPMARNRGPGSAIAINVAKFILTSLATQTQNTQHDVTGFRHAGPKEDPRMSSSMLVSGLSATLLLMGCTTPSAWPTATPPQFSARSTVSHTDHSNTERQWQALSLALREQADWWERQAEAASGDEGPLGSVYAVERKLAIAKALREEAREAEYWFQFERTASQVK